MRTKTLLSLGIVGLVGAAASIACSVTFSPPTAGFTAFTPYGSCSTDGYAIAAAEDCPGVSCGAEYYAICNGTAWVGCDCTLADVSGYTLITSPSFTGVPVAEGGAPPGNEAGGMDGPGGNDGAPGSDGAGSEGGPPGQGESGAPGDGGAGSG